MSLIITGLLVSLLALGTTATIVFWTQILKWSEDNVFPWFERHLPTIAPYVRQAFSRVDNVVTSVRRAAKEAWNRVSQYLLKQVVKLNRQTSNTWVQQVTSWVIDVSDRNKQPVVKQITTTEEDIPWDNIPQEWRQKALATKETSFETDVTEVRKQEMALIN